MARYRHLINLENPENMHPSSNSAENSTKIRSDMEVVEWKLTLDFCGPTVYVGDVAFDIAANQIFDMKLCGFPVVCVYVFSIFIL